ncbi:phosphatase PAP2 family protein [Paenarthrobacter sp. 2TAF44]|uniref:phosphatase PAP2 family protein n=1 Tax=Paenarthrobacter sp. 2TAF44 TaxID=3233018 RepID=UPI003F9CD846
MFPQSTPGSVPVQRLPAPKHWLTVGLILVAVVIAVGLAVQSVPGFTSAELAVDQNFSRNHNPVLTGLALALNLLFEPVVGALVVLATSLYLLLIRRSPQKAVLFALTVGSGWLSCQLFKVVIGRIRPDPTLLLDPLAPEPISNSFPSGHTCLAVALAIAAYFLARGSRAEKPVLWTGMILAVIVAWSRVYIGAHYPLDVMASFPATIGVVVLMAGLWNRQAPSIVARLQSARSSRSDASPHRKKP